MRRTQRSDDTLRRVSLCWSAAALLPLAAVCAPRALLAASADAVPVQSEELQEVVVSAEKRSETVQEAPLSITAISGGDLEAADRGRAPDVYLLRLQGPET